MSDLLTHWAAFDDLRRIAMVDEKMAPELVDVLTEETEACRLGALSRGGNKWVPTILQALRPQWNSGDKRMGEKLAFALGGVAHYPADVVMKPMTRRVSQKAWEMEHPGESMEDGPGEMRSLYYREASAYYDTHVFRKVYGDGAEPPFGGFQFLLTENHSDIGVALEAFVRSLFQRALLSSHTLSPDKENILPWLDRLFDLLQPLYIDINMYVRVYTSPDPRKLEIYEVLSHFYLDDDPAIQVARRIQAGESVASDALDDAVRKGQNRSAYGQILELGVQRMRETSEWWQGKTEQLPDLRQGGGH
ncbi:MAG: hypothetical protein D6820_07445 [Lentisphaerae bacterium]|nr:MAG: hypothetical protein D6820_07445 [Lentisphaerota bacterium]